jgi:hypothetical protein
VFLVHRERLVQEVFRVNEAFKDLLVKRERLEILVLEDTKETKEIRETLVHRVFRVSRVFKDSRGTKVTKVTRVSRVFREKRETLVEHMNTTSQQYQALG